MALRLFTVGLSLICLLTIAATISFAGWAIFQSAMADGKIDYCYTTTETGVLSSDFHVYGHRRWRNDTLLVTFKNPADAETWRSQKCPR